MGNWLTRLVSPRARRQLVPARPLDSFPAAGGVPPFLGGGRGGRAAQLAAYQGWVFAAVNLIAQRVAGVPLRLYRQTGEGRAELARHPLLSLLARPNPLLSGRQLRFCLVSHLELTGMAFWLIAEDQAGRPAELWPLLPSDLVEIKPGPDTGRPIAAFVFQTPGGGRVSHPPEKILYFRHPSPRSLLYGQSPVAAMAHAFDIDLAVRLYQRNFFANSARPEVVLQTDQRLGDEEARRILAAWRQKHQGLAHVFEPTLLDGGLKVQPLTFSAKDFEFLGLAGWTQDNLLAAFGVPAGKLGLVKDVNRANAEGIDLTFNAECVKPRLDLIEDVLAFGLLPRYGEDLALAHDNPVPKDRAQGHQEAMDQLRQGALTINEYRASLGRPPVAWGDAPYRAAADPQAAPVAAPVAAPADSATAKEVDLAAHLARDYPRLLARFAGWSAGRVARELAAKPELLTGLCPPELTGPPRRRLLRALAACLGQGLDLEQTLEHVARAGREEA